MILFANKQISIFQAIPREFSSSGIGQKLHDVDVLEHPDNSNSKRRGRIDVIISKLQNKGEEENGKSIFKNVLKCKALRF